MGFRATDRYGTARKVREGELRSDGHPQKKKLGKLWSCWIYLYMHTFVATSRTTKRGLVEGQAGR